MPAKSLELTHTIKLIQELTAEIDEIGVAIKQIMNEDIQYPILTIPSISYRMGAMILAEIGDFSWFDSADKILAYAGMSPSIYQSGKLDNCHSHIEKRGSKYLRYALYNATKYVCLWDESFGVSWSSIIVTLGSINLSCKSLLKWSKIVIICVRSQVVVPNKDIATHGMIQLIVRAELILINHFLLEGMIESLYRSIIIRTAGFTHTLRNTM